MWNTMVSKGLNLPYILGRVSYWSSLIGLDWVTRKPLPAIILSHLSCQLGGYSHMGPNFRWVLGYLDLVLMLVR